MKFVVNCILSVLIFNALTAITKAQIHHASNRSIDLLLGASDGTVLKKSSNQTKELFGLTGKDEISGLVRNKNHLYILENNHLYRCEFNWDKLELSNNSCTRKSFFQGPDAVKPFQGIAIVEEHLFLGGNNGSLYVCDLGSERPNCHENAKLDKKISGMAYDSNKRRLYVSTWNGKLFACDIKGSGSRMGVNCTQVFKFDGPWFFSGLTSVHVAYDAVWLGSENGRLLRCDESSGKFDCPEFDEIEWKAFSHPTIYGFGSGNGYLYAALKGKSRNDLWKCQPGKPKSCQTTIQLPADTRSILQVN